MDTRILVIAIAFSGLVILAGWWAAEQAAKREKRQRTRAEHYKRNYRECADRNRRLETIIMEGQQVMLQDGKNVDELRRSLADKDATIICMQKRTEGRVTHIMKMNARTDRAIACDTPRANATVKRMCRILRGDV